MAPAGLKRMTREEFYRWPGDEDVRYELADGVPVAMPRGNRRHDCIVVNIICCLHGRLRDASPAVHTAKIGIATGSTTVRRPDVSVDCGPRFDASFEASLPRLVIEVLSPSARQTDLVRKLEEYKVLPSLSYILLVEPDLPRVLLWWRAPGNVWELAQFDGLEGVIGLPEIGTQLGLAELYEDVAFPDPLAGGAALG